MSKISSKDSQKSLTAHQVSYFLIISLLISPTSLLTLEKITVAKERKGRLSHLRRPIRRCSMAGFREYMQVTREQSDLNGSFPPGPPSFCFSPIVPLHCVIDGPPRKSEGPPFCQLSYRAIPSNGQLLTMICLQAHGRNGATFTISSFIFSPLTFPHSVITSFSSSFNQKQFIQIPRPMVFKIYSISPFRRFISLPQNARTINPIYSLHFRKQTCSSSLDIKPLCLLPHSEAVSLTSQYQQCR